MFCCLHLRTLYPHEHLCKWLCIHIQPKLHYLSPPSQHHTFPQCPFVHTPFYAGTSVVCCPFVVLVCYSLLYHLSQILSSSFVPCGNEIPRGTTAIFLFHRQFQSRWCGVLLGAPKSKHDYLASRVLLSCYALCVTS